MAGVATYTVTSEEDGMRLDRWFKRRIPTLSLSHLNKIVRTGQVRVDAARVKTSTRLVAGALVRVPPLELAPAAPAVVARTGSEADRRALREMTLHEDRDVLVLNKPWGLAVQGGSGTRHHLDGMLEALARPDGERPRLVHRLDRETSGVLLIAMRRRVAADLGEIFRSRQARKTYWAMVEGVPKPASGRISLFLAKGEDMGGSRRADVASRSSEHGDTDRERVRVARHGDPEAQHSVTYYAVVDKIPARVAWLAMRPITGRTHQLRAHAEAIGHPIVGDGKYGRIAENDPRRTDPMRALPAGIERKLHLLARRLVLPHPAGGTLDATAPLPSHMRRSWELFGFDPATPDPTDDAD